MKKDWECWAGILEGREGSRVQIPESLWWFFLISIALSHRPTWPPAAFKQERFFILCWRVDTCKKGRIPIRFWNIPCSALYHYYLLVTSCGEKTCTCSPKELRDFQAVISVNICLIINRFHEIFISRLQGENEAKVREKMSQCCFHFCFKLGTLMKNRQGTSFSHCCVP